MNLLRELLKTNENAGSVIAADPTTDLDFQSMSDDDLIRLCYELEMEDLCELDDDGRITNREELIRDLEAGHNSEQGGTMPGEQEYTPHEDDVSAEVGGGRREPRFEMAMPQGVIKQKQKIAKMTDEERKEYFKGMAKDQCERMEKRNCVRPGTYAKYLTECAVVNKKYKKYTNVRSKMNYMKPVKIKEAETVKFKQVANGKKKLPLPAYGGLQKDVKNKTAAQAIEDEIGDAGLKGMTKKDRPYNKKERPSFKDWLTGNMVFDMTPSGELAGSMKLGEEERIDELKVPSKLKRFAYGTAYETQPEGVIKRVKGMSDREVSSLHQHYEKEGEVKGRARGTPADIQKRALKREYEKRQIAFPKLNTVGEALLRLTDVLDEKWGEEVKVPEKEKGKHSHKTLEELRSQLASAKEAGNTDLMRELNFAIRAKTGWKSVN